MDYTTPSKVYDLEQPRYFGAPVHPSHAPGLIYSLHRRHKRGASETRTSASGFVYMAEHSGTHIDALCHQAEDMHLYGGQEVNLQVQTPLVLRRWALRPFRRLSNAAFCWMWHDTKQWSA